MNPYIFLVIILVILGGYGIVLYTKNKQSSEISKIDEKKSAVFDIPVDSVILTLKNMHLSGKTKRLYESWASRWDNLVQETLPDIEEKLEQAEQYAEQLRLIQSKKSITHAKQLVDDAEKLAFQIDEALQRIVDSETTNHEEIETISRQYKELRNDILADSVKYKEAFQTIEVQLSSIHEDIEHFNQLMEEADYIEAKDVLKAVDKATVQLKEKIIDIPTLYAVFDNDFSEQLDDLKAGHQRMVDLHFQFNNIDVAVALEQLQSDIEEARHHVTQLNLELAQEKRQTIAKEIERLYTVMETEITAKEDVVRGLPKIKEKLEKIKENNRHVANEIERVSQNYELTDDEEEIIQKFKEQLETETDGLEHHQQLVDKQEAVYSVIKEYIVELSHRLSGIDAQQASMMHELANLKEREHDVREQMDMFELDLRNMKRSLEKRHLPGISKNYLDLFFATTKRVETLSEKLNRIKIDMKEIDADVALCIEDIEHLDEATEHIIDNAMLTEQLIQYANRYRMEHASIEKAITTSINLYQHQYKYAEAKQTIATALNSVEPGAVSRVENLYHEEKNRRTI